MEAICRIELFGGLRVTLKREAITRFPTHKAGLLLAYLALTPGKPQTREHLLDWLWPERESNVGRNNLSTLLSLLRRILEPYDTPAGSILQTDRQTIYLNPANVSTDVGEFDALIQRAARTPDMETRVQCWQEAACLAKGELLPDCYEEWALQARRVYKERYAQILRRRASLLFDLGRYEEAQEDAACALLANTCDEEACVLQMRALAALGRRETALQAYARLEKALQTTLTATPNTVTRALQEQIRANPDIFRVPASGVKNAPVDESVSVTKNAPAASGVPAAQNAPASPANATHANLPRLPAPLTRFFGREREVAELQNLLNTPDTRLITLLGAGGAGKTRLALEVARTVSSRYQGRVWFVSLADVPAPALIPMLLLHALNLPTGQGDPLEAVITMLSDAPALLLLDNMEHLLAESESKTENPLMGGGQALLRHLLERAPTLTCLATSRHPLHLEGEQEYALPPLALPVEGYWLRVEGQANAERGRMKDEAREQRTENREQKSLNPGVHPQGRTQPSTLNLYPSQPTPLIPQLLACASIALYVDRAQKAKADFALTVHNAQAVTELCRKLEGMPLAIEMAAAWIKTVPPARMLQRLEHQLEILVSRRRDLPARQQSLRATCEWSYALLSPDLQPAFARLSLFRGGWTLDAAAAIWKGEGEGRQGDKETRRQGEEESGESDEQNAADSSLIPHPSWLPAPSTLNPQPSALFLLTELQERSLIVPVGMGEWEADGREVEEGETEPRYRMLEPLREFGLEKLVESGEVESVSRTHAQYFGAMATQANNDKAGAEARAGLASLKREQDNLRAALAWYRQNDGRQGLSLAVNLARFWEVSGAFVEGRQWLGKMLALPTAQEPIEERAAALRGAGTLSLLHADYADAQQLYTEAKAIFTALNHLRGQADALHGLGNIALYEQQYAQAREYYEQSLQLRVQAGDTRGISTSCHSLGNLEMREENYDSARAFMERALALRREMNDEIRVAQTLGSLGQLACHQEQYAVALNLFCEILRAFQRLGVPWSIALCLRDIAEVFWYQGHRKRVVCLIGAAQALREATGFRVPPAEREIHAQQLAELREEVGEDVFAQAWTQGHAMNADQAVSYALEQIQSSCSR